MDAVRFLLEVVERSRTGPAGAGGGNSETGAGGGDSETAAEVAAVVAAEG
jgi:hypothetical protein